jgi:two-component sensor histidine kinase
VEGDVGELPAELATPLAVVLAELLQNAVGHAFPEDMLEGGRVLVSLSNQNGALTVRVHDNGVGLPEGFSVADAGNLGLTIVRSLVTTELGGTIDMKTDGGTLVELHVPARATRRAEL